MSGWLSIAAGGEAAEGASALIKIALVFAVMVLLIRRGLAIGYVLVIAAGLLGLALAVGFADATGAGLRWVAGGVWNLLGEIATAVTLPDSLRLLSLVLLVSVFGAVMGHVEKLRALADSLLALLRDRRWAIGSVASLIGLLPMPGGTIISAPMVGEMARGVDLTREEKAAINHWMRHIWEYVDPLYPGLLLAATILGVPVAALMLWQSPLCLMSIAAGAVFLLRRIPRHQRLVGDHAGARAFRPVVVAIAPVLVIIAAALLPLGLPALAKHVPGAAELLPGGRRWLEPDYAKWAVKTASEVSMLAALAGTVVVLLAANRVTWRQSWALVRQGATAKMTALVLGVCAMKGVLEASGTLKPIAAFLGSTGLPTPVVVGTVVFVVGMLIGFTQGYIAICYTMLLPMLRPEGGVNFPLATFAFAAGFLGVLLSPTHLCLVLSREHFEAKWGGLYRLLLVPSLLVLGTACLMLIWA